MNLKRTVIFFAALWAVLAVLMLPGCSTNKPYQESLEGNYLYLNPFAYVPATVQEHLTYAQSLREKGRLTKARKQFSILVKRWPDQAEAVSAKQAVAEIYHEQGKNKKAFTAYEELVKQYYTAITDYHAILEQQSAIAIDEMNRKRMRWLFGGYRAPTRAVPFFESIVQNAPQWERAPEMQYKIGEAYQQNDELDLAVVAYSIVEYRYPDSPFAEKAAVSKMESYRELVASTPYSEEIREQAQLSTGLFCEIYTNSPHLSAAQAFCAELRELSAKHSYETGRFYERIPRPPKYESAEIYYKKASEQYEGTEYAEKADLRRESVLRRKAAEAGNPIETIFNQLKGQETNSAARKGAARITPWPLPERTSTNEGAVEVTADRMEYADDLLTGDGHVAVQHQDASVQADRMTVNSKTGEIHADGNIILLREGLRWEGQKLSYNYKTQEGVLGESFMYFEPVYITAGSTERISTNEFLLRDAVMTTCSGENPVVYAKAGEVRVLDENKPSGVFVQAKKVTFYVGSVPVLYVPVWKRHLGYRIFSTRIGGDSRLGAFVMTRAELHPAEWLTSNTHLDLFSKRGLGLGQDFHWLTPGGKGGIEAYSIHDEDPRSDEDDTAAEKALIDPQRYRIKVRHREELADETYFAGRLDWLSDPVFLRDFYEEEYRAAASPENYAVVQHSAETYAASVRADGRLNDFYTSVNRLPEMTFDLYRTRIGSTPFFFQSDNNITFLENLQQEIPSVISPDNERSIRLDTHNQVFMPLRFQDFFNVIPRTGYRGTWYSDTVSGDPKLRNFYEAGALTSFKAYKPLTEKSGFYGTGLKHVVEPYADYSYRTANLHANEFFQFDPVDALDDENEVRFGIRNFLQSKRGVNRLANVLDSDVYAVYRLNPDSTERTFSEMGAEAELSLTDQFSVLSDMEYNWYTHDLNPANARLQWETDDQSEYSFEYRYLQGVRSLFTPRVKLFPNDTWSYDFSVSYDGYHDEWFERKVMVTRKFDCIGAGAGVRLDEDEDVHVWFQLWLTAFPDGFFGM